MLPKSTAEYVNQQAKQYSNPDQLQICREMKLNKGTILKASCDYIRQLRRERDIMFQQTQQSQQMEEASKQYLKRIRELEQALEKNGLNVPPPDEFITSARSLPRPIKQEPSYDDQLALSPSQTPTGSLVSGGEFDR